MLKRSAFILFLTIWCISSSSQGLMLFTPEMREAVTQPQRVVMDFLERYFQELSAVKGTTVQAKMTDDKVFFRKGKPSDLYHVSDTMGFTISLLDKYYEVNWTIENEPFITIVFPAQYDLLMGQDKEEALTKMKETILAAPKRNEKNVIPADLKMQGDGIWQSKKESFELESLNDAIYYNKVREEYVPVFDNSHLSYSAANLFHGLIPATDYRMYVEQSVYGMSTISYTITLNQWHNYCAEWGLKVFFAVEEEREDGILALIIAQSRELGFNHLLSVVIPDKFITDKNAVLKVRLSPYIPTHNVKDLYQKEATYHKKKVLK